MYEIVVSFTSDRPGFYEQWLVFDFDMRPVLLQKLNVNVGEQLLQQRDPDIERTQHSTDSTSSPLKANTAADSEQLWQEGNVKIVQYYQWTEEELELLKTYRWAKRHLNLETTGTGSITHQNYKEKMHRFLYQEEMEEDRLVRR